MTFEISSKMWNPFLMSFTIMLIPAIFWRIAVHSGWNWTHSADVEQGPGQGILLLEAKDEMAPPPCPHSWTLVRRRREMGRPANPPLLTNIEACVFPEDWERERNSCYCNSCHCHSLFFLFHICLCSVVTVEKEWDNSCHSGWEPECIGSGGGRLLKKPQSLMAQSGALLCERQLPLVKNRVATVARTVSSVWRSSFFFFHFCLGIWLNLKFWLFSLQFCLFTLKHSF